MTKTLIIMTKQYTFFIFVLIPSTFSITYSMKEQDTSLPEQFLAPINHFFTSTPSAPYRQGPPTLSPNNSGFTAIHCAAYNDQIELVKELLKTEPKDHKTTDNFTPLHYAAYQGNNEIVAYLLKQGSNSNARSLDNITPLHCALRQEHLQTVGLLLQHGARLDIQDDTGQTPLDLARTVINQDITSMIAVIHNYRKKLAKLAATCQRALNESGSSELIDKDDSNEEFYENTSPEEENTPNSLDPMAHLDDNGKEVIHSTKVIAEIEKLYKKQEHKKILSTQQQLEEATKTAHEHEAESASITRAQAARAYAKERNGPRHQSKKRGFCSIS